MDIERVTSARAVDPALAAWAAAVEALSADAAATGEPAPIGDDLAALPGAVASATQRAAVQVQAGLDPSLPVGEAARAGVDTDAGREANALQGSWRAFVPTTELPRGTGHDAAPLPLAAAQAGRAVADALLVPALLSGLRAEAAARGPLPHPAAPDATAYPGAVARRDGAPSRHDERRDAPAPEPETEHDAAPAAPDRRTRRDEGSPDGVLDAAADGAWSDALTAALRQALRPATAPQALTTAAEQWRRGRCVVLACPQGHDPAGPAWAFVLWPRQGTPGQDLPDLFGLRVSARLRWHELPPPAPWCHGRALKEHHPRHGRQLVAAGSDPARPEQPVACEVQLGPVASRPLRRCDVRVLIQAAQRFWAALGRQWSVHVVVGARPLLAAREMPEEIRPC